MLRNFLFDRFFLNIFKVFYAVSILFIALIAFENKLNAQMSNTDKKDASKFKEICSRALSENNIKDDLIRNCFSFIVQHDLFRNHSIPRKIEGNTTDRGDNFWDLRAYLLQSNKQPSFINNLACVDLQILVYSWLEIVKFINKINGPAVWFDCAKAVYVTRSVITNDETLNSINYRSQCSGFDAKFLEKDYRNQLFEHVYQCLYGKNFTEDGQAVKLIISNCEETAETYNEIMQKVNFQNYGYRTHLAAHSSTLVEWDQLKNIRSSINASTTQRHIFRNPFKCKDIFDFAIKRNLINNTEYQDVMNKLNSREDAAKIDQAAKQENIRNAEKAKIDAEIQSCKFNIKRGQAPESIDITNAMNKALFFDCNAGGITRRMLKNGNGNPLLSIVGRARHDGEWCRIQDTGIRHANVNPLRCIRSAENQFECAANVELACKLFSANDVFGADIMRENLMCSPYRSARYQVVIKLIQDDRCNWALVPD